MGHAWIHAWRGGSRRSDPDSRPRCGGSPRCRPRSRRRRQLAVTSHSFPLNTFQMLLRSRVERTGVPGVIVATSEADALHHRQAAAVLLNEALPNAGYRGRSRRPPGGCRGRRPAGTATGYKTGAPRIRSSPRKTTYGSPSCPDIAASTSFTDTALSGVPRTTGCRWKSNCVRECNTRGQRRWRRLARSSVSPLSQVKAPKAGSVSSNWRDRSSHGRKAAQPHPMSLLTSPHSWPRRERPQKSQGWRHGFGRSAPRSRSWACSTYPRVGTYSSFSTSNRIPLPSRSGRILGSA